MDPNVDNQPAGSFNADIKEILVAPDDGRLLKHDLIERVKELNCLYGISRLMENRDDPLDHILERVVDLIPPAWQYPDVAAACIMVNKRQFQTRNFRDTPWKQKETISVKGKEIGSLEVGYLQEKPLSFEGPFLKEEKALIHVLAQRIGSIIEQKTAEASLSSLYKREKSLRKKLQKEIHNRVDFSRKLIHELKTPLTSLMATSQYLTLIEQNQLSETGRIAGLVWESANRLNNRIEELHDVIKGEVGSLKVNLKSISIVQLLSSIEEETRALVREHEISIRIEADPGLPEVMADPERIGQVLLNFINNACKYASSGKYVIIKVTQDSPSTLKIEVRDRGPGISREKQRLLFRPGYRINRVLNKSGGLGIGLTLCKILINLHGGKIWVESKLGRGSSFFFTLATTGYLDKK